MRKERRSFICIDYSTRYTAQVKSLVDNYDYINESKGRIILSNGREEDDIVIGCFVLQNLLLDLAINESYSTWEVCDDTRAIHDIMSHLLDEDTEDFIPNIDSNNGMNTLIIEKIEINPEYRGRGYGEKALREIVRRFSTSVSVNVLKAFPLQFDLTYSREDRRHKFSMLEKSKRKARVSLCSFYRKCGFGHVAGIPKEIMVLVNR